MSSLSTVVVESLKFSDFVMGLVTGDLTDGVARKRSRGDAGPSIAWIIGHVLDYRYQILGLLGHAEKNPLGARFGTSASDGRGYPPIEELAAAWNALSPRVLSAVAAASDEQLGAPPAAGEGPHAEKKVLDTLVFFMWHEASHLGQIGTLRSHFGLTPTSTLAIEASKARAR